jgi:hypothetical protein
MTDKPRRQTLVFGKTVDFQSRNTHISTVRWRSRFKEEYASAHDVRILEHSPNFSRNLKREASPISRHSNQSYL